MSSLRVDLEWQSAGLCAQTDPEAFHPEKGDSVKAAKQVCMGCTVRTACLEYALAQRDRFGVWGATTERERRRILAERDAQARQSPTTQEAEEVAA